MNVKKVVGGVVLLAVGAFVAILATDFRNQAAYREEQLASGRANPARLYGGQTLSTLEREAEGLRTKSTATYAGAAIAIVAGLGLLITARSKPAAPSRS